MLYRKLKRTWSHGYLNHIPNFQKEFPELIGVDSEELCDRFSRLGLDFYTEKKTPIKWWIRITLPFALLLMLLMLIFLPFNYMFTGEWGYSLGDKNRILNYLKALRLQ